MAQKESIKRRFMLLGFVVTNIKMFSLINSMTHKILARLPKKRAKDRQEHHIVHLAELSVLCYFLQRTRYSKNLEP